MEFKVVKQINKTTRIELNLTDERDIKEAILKVGWLLEMPYKCGKCGSENIKFSARKASKDKTEYVFPEIYCFDCKAKRPMGEYDGVGKGGIFFKKWEDPYNPNADGQDDDGFHKSKELQEDDVPF
jgi:DNA-directed RNA polymerase subunit RPC12/RpoP